MQLVDAPSDVLTETSGFTLVEEDDVAFGLGLCREVHRLYNDYQDGKLPHTEAVRAGLMVTVEMLAILSRSVRDGMPSMRIMVAAAQTREMLAVVFDYDPMDAFPDPGLREMNRSVVTRSAGRSLKSAGGLERAGGRGAHPAPELPAPAGSHQPLVHTGEPAADLPADHRAESSLDMSPAGQPYLQSGSDAPAEAPKAGWFQRLTRRRRTSEPATAAAPVTADD